MNRPTDPPEANRDARQAPWRAWLAEHPLAALCLVAMISGGLVFAVMKQTPPPDHGPKIPAESRAHAAPANHQTLLPGSPASFPDSAQNPPGSNDWALADLKNKVRILEQSLNLAKTQEHLAQVALTEERKAKAAADKLLTDQAPQIDALRLQLEELTRGLATNNQAGLSRETLDSLVAQTARQRARFNVRAHAIWRRWVDLALTEVDGDAARFLGKLEKGMSYNDAVAEFSKLKANNDRYTEFADGCAVILANMLVAIENEMWRRFSEKALNPETRDTFAQSIGDDIRMLRDWETLLQATPDRGQSSVQDWLRDLITLQSRFYNGHFDANTGVIK